MHACNRLAGSQSRATSHPRFMEGSRLNSGLNFVPHPLPFLIFLSFLYPLSLSNKQCTLDIQYMNSENETTYSYCSNTHKYRIIMETCTIQHACTWVCMQQPPHKYTVLLLLDRDFELVHDVLASPLESNNS